MVQALAHLEVLQSSSIARHFKGTLITVLEYEQLLLFAIICAFTPEFTLSKKTFDDENFVIWFGITKFYNLLRTASPNIPAREPDYYAK